MTRDELIAALEKAERPSWTLNVEIALFLGWEHAGGARWRTTETERNGTVMLPDWTGSIDEALTMVWDDVDVSLVVLGSKAIPHPDRKVGRNAGVIITRLLDEYKRENLADVDHGIPAIAICIAALKARRT